MPNALPVILKLPQCFETPTADVNSNHHRLKKDLVILKNIKKFKVIIMLKIQQRLFKIV